MPTRHVSLTVAATVCVCVTSAEVRAADIALSSLLGVSPGQSTSNDHPPYMDFFSGYALGMNCPGSWSPDPIKFGDAGVLEHGIGHHPPEFGEGRVEFDLEAIAAEFGPITEFTARVGIERFSQPGAGVNGAIFRVYADGVRVAEVTVASGFSPSVPLSVPISGVRTLRLCTEHIGAWNGNHACWGLATLVTCKADFDGTGFVDTDDFTAFVLAFEAGTDDADFDGTGFVDTDDFTAFVLAFEAGC